VGAFAASCSKTSGPSAAVQALPAAQIAVEPGAAAKAPERTMTVHFYDVGQGLAVLVDLPDGRHVLVDAGDRPHRPSCGDVCDAANHHLLAKLREDLAGAPLDVLWITHEHSDHIGGAPEVLEAFPTIEYVDNGRDGNVAEVRRARRSAEEHHTVVGVVDPDHRDFSRLDSPGVKVTPVLPAAWPAACHRDANECSIGLLVAFGGSSVLFTGDAEHEEETALDPLRPVTLLQVGHHGSETSSSPAFLSRVRPRYAVISAGRPHEGLNRTYCHPRASIVERLSRVLASSGAQFGAALQAFDGERCSRARASDWVAVPASDALWATERDGDVVLTTTGDGTFTRVTPARGPASAGLSAVRP
jgi:competence protein ComEC